MIVEYDITNASDQPLTDVWLGLWHDLVVRNVVTTTESGGQFFNKGGVGFLGYPTYEAETGDVLDADPDSQYVSYAFNAGGQEESLNTYGAVAFLGAEWEQTPGQTRFFHPNVAEAVPERRPAGAARQPALVALRRQRARPALLRPDGDDGALPPHAGALSGPSGFGPRPPTPPPSPSFLGARRRRRPPPDRWPLGRGNWIGLTSVGPFPDLAPARRVTVAFAVRGRAQAGRVPGRGLRPRRRHRGRARALRNNVFWAQETYAGEDANYNGALDPGEDINGNGVLDRYLIPEPADLPRPLRVPSCDEAGRAVLYWSDLAESSVDPVTGAVRLRGLPHLPLRPRRRPRGQHPGRGRPDRAVRQARQQHRLQQRPRRRSASTTPVTFPGDHELYTLPLRRATACSTAGSTPSP